MMRVLVCGGRNFSAVQVIREMTKLNEAHGPFESIIHGGYGNTDFAAGRWGQMNRKQVAVFDADWQRYGKSAGPIRNQKMLDEGKPDLVIAFPGGAGTAHMTRIAHIAGVDVISVKDGAEGLTEDQRDEYEERTAIMMADAGMTEEQAEKEAFKRITERDAE